MKAKKIIFGIISAFFAVIFIFFPACLKNDSPDEFHQNAGAGEPKKFTITYHLDGGYFQDDDIPTEFVEGETVELPVPVKNDFEFKGWYDNEDLKGAKYLAVDGKYAHSNKEFWAGWTKIESSDPIEPPEQHPEPPPKPAVYSITFNLNGGEFADGELIEEYTAGTHLILPQPVRPGFIFCGWFDNSAFLGNKIIEITAESTGDKVFYAKWDVPEEVLPEKYKIDYELNGGKFDKEFPNEYVKGETTVLPVPVYEGYSFEGWYDNENFNGSPIYEISSVSVGNVKLFAKWRKNETEEENAIKIIDYGGYCEGAFVEFSLSENNNAVLMVAYSKSTADEWKFVDTEMIKDFGKYIRTDIPGLIAGNYDIRIYAQGNEITLKGIEVTSYDRSGYAHFDMYIGVGAYDSDGSEKSGAKILHVTEQNKNTVELNIGFMNYTGISDIISNLGKLNGAPLIIRIIGKVTLGNLQVNGAKNVTIEGVGDDAEIVKGSFDFTDCSFIEIKNLLFSDFNGCALNFSAKKSPNGISSSERIWVHNNEFSNADVAVNSYPDAGISFKNVSYVTVSYNEYYTNNLAERIENQNSEVAFYTFHHNIYNGCMALDCKNANIHLYNNYYSAGMTGLSLIRADSGANLFMEKCLIADCVMPPFEIKNAVMKIWNIKSENCSDFKAEGVYLVENRQDKVWTNTPGANFDTDKSEFYYNDGQTSVRDMLEKDEIKDKLPKLSGTHKK